MRGFIIKGQGLDRWAGSETLACEIPFAFWWTGRPAV